MQGQVKYVNRGVEHFGTYRVDGRMLELSCRLGTRRAVIGLFEAKVLARKLLKFLVTKADREVPRKAEPRVVDRPETPRSTIPWTSMPLVRVTPNNAKRAPFAGASTPPVH